MSTLQLGLIVAGVLLVIGVIVYNQWQERRLKRQAASAASTSALRSRPHARARRADPWRSHRARRPQATASRRFEATPISKRAFEPPVDVIRAARRFRRRRGVRQ